MKAEMKSDINRFVSDFYRIFHLAYSGVVVQTRHEYTPKKSDSMKNIAKWK